MKFITCFPFVAAKSFCYISYTDLINYMGCHEVGQVFKKFSPNKSILHYKTSDLDVLMSAKFNNLNYLT